MNNVYYVNDDAEEYCTLPDPTRPQQLAIVGYLLFEGPLDGTAFTSYPDIEELCEEIEARKREERRSEGRLFLKYVREKPDYVVNQFERIEEGYPVDPEDYDIEADIANWFREFCAQKAQSHCRDDNGNWQEHKLARVCAASLTFQEYFEYLGRWHDDGVRLALDEQTVADYDDITDDVVHEMHQTLPDRFLADGEYLLTPDMVMTVSDDDGGGDGDEDEASGGGDSEKRLFPTN